MSGIVRSAALLICAFAWTDVAAAAPPSIDRTLKELEKTPPCLNRTQMRGESAVVERPETPRVQFLCAAQTPDTWLQRMASRRISAACGSVFDLDPKGVPKNIETHCNVATAKDQLDADWRKYFETTIAVMAMRAVSFMRYAPVDAERPDEKREDLFLKANFSFGGPALPDMEKFERSKLRQ